MIFTNPSVPTLGADNNGPYSTWSFAHDGKGGIVPAHSVCIKNVGSTVDALLTHQGGTYGLTLSPGDIATIHVPAGDEIYAGTVSGTADLEVIASVL